MKKISSFVFLLLLISGCATLPKTVEIGPAEIGAVVERFRAMIAEGSRCASCIDAAARVEFKSVFNKGVVSGYLQAMSPSCLKFVGINPLGQPLVVLVSDGERFHYLLVPEAKGFQGNVSGETFAKYAPHGFQSGQSFYWLVGRLAPGLVKVMAVSRDQEEQGYWLSLLTGKNGIAGMVLFDDKDMVIRRHLLVDDQDEIVMNISYDDYTPAPCPRPGRITISSPAHNGSLEIKLTDWLDDVSLGPEYFSCRLPAGFSRVVVP